MKRIFLPMTRDIRVGLHAGEELLLCGRIYTARDSAHKRLSDAIRKDKDMPIDMVDSILYYCGPTPARQGMVIGSCGPTTSSRMDSFTPALLKKGVAGFIGKGRRSEEIRRAIKKYKGVYLAAIGGAGAYLSKRVKRAKLVAYRDLGPESIYELWVEDFPVTVAIDSSGRSIHGTSR